jgi:hypothetical protein
MNTAMDISGLSDEDIDALLGTNADPAQLDDLKQQLELARNLKMRGLTPSEPIQAGKRVLPNYGGAISQVISGYMGNKQEAAAKAAQTALYDKEKLATSAWYKAQQGRNAMRSNNDDLMDWMNKPEQI